MTPALANVTGPRATSGRTTCFTAVSAKAKGFGARGRSRFSRTGVSTSGHVRQVKVKPIRKEWSNPSSLTLLPATQWYCNRDKSNRGGCAAERGPVQARSTHDRIRMLNLYRTFPHCSAQGSQTAETHETLETVRSLASSSTRLVTKRNG